MTTTKTTRTPSSPAETFSLQQYRSFLIRGIATRISSRVLCAANAAFLIFMNHLSPYQIAGSALAAIVISLLWQSEFVLLTAQIDNIEEAMAKRSGDEWEDIYIKLRYLPSGYSLLRRLISREPLLWLSITIVIILLRIFLPNASS